MKALMGLFVLAFSLSLVCGQMPSGWTDVEVFSPTMAPAAEGGGLARVTVTGEGRQDAGAPTATGTTEGDGGHVHEGGGGQDARGPGVTGTAAASQVTVEATAVVEATRRQDAGAPTGAATGALVRVTMASEVGVLLDEFPGEMRGRVVEALLAGAEEEWLARAARQVRLTRLRLNFRDSNLPGKGQLPLPQPDQWSIGLDDAGPGVRTVQGHELVMVGYTLTTTILSSAESVAASEPALAEVGGVWEEYFLLPADPDLLLQRTGRACLNDAGFPPNSIDSQNAGHFYDYDRQNCFEVLAGRVGAIETEMRFERVAWDEALAARVRTPLPERGQGADLAVVGADLAHHYLSYRFVRESDCALVEGAVGAAGWRRLLHFEATVHNVGDIPLHIGPATAGAGPAESGESPFVYAPCHDHVHFRHYGIFTLDEGELEASKQAFCVQSTDRMSNHELSPLTHDYSCRFQGIQVGWVDEYIAGLDTQWVDVTGLEVGPEGRTVALGFVSNPEGFLCEGQPAFDAEGALLWEPSGLQTEEGVEIFRPQCAFAEEWDGNNVASIEVFVPPVGSMVTGPCLRGEQGPLRDCGFEALTLEGVEEACRVGQPVNLRLSLEEGALPIAAPVVVRACERSAALGTGVACTFGESLANVVLEGGPGTVSFDCPAVRDGEAVDGNFALYVGAVWEGDEVGRVEVGE